MTTKSTKILLILDGWGYLPSTISKQYNAIANAKVPNWDSILAKYPSTLLSASGLDVGLPDNQMGNSEIGHLTMGAGRTIYQDLTQINLAIENKNFFKNEVLAKIFNSTKQTVHLMGLLSPGGVHSHEQHLLAILDYAAQLRNANPDHFPKIAIHAFLDGRDTPPKSALKSIELVEQHCKKLNLGRICSISGRFYAMDRDNRMERTAAVYNMLVMGTTQYYANNATDAIEQSYLRGETDEFVTPTIINPANKIIDGDAVISFNFRTDRMRQLCYKLCEPTSPKLAAFATMTHYADDLPSQVIFPKQKLDNILGEYISRHNLTQLRLAETEKYAHVTFFINGGEEKIYPGEDRILIPSPKVETYDQQPEMAAYQITDALITAINSHKYDLIIVNYANADMVGHTGNFAATKVAIEVLDNCLGKIVTAVQNNNSELLITADHGNAECMFDPETKQAHTAHTSNLVPLVYVGPRKLIFKSNPTRLHILADIAPTLLTLMSLPMPKEMTGQNMAVLKETP